MIDDGRWILIVILKKFLVFLIDKNIDEFLIKCFVKKIILKLVFIVEMKI